MHRIQVHELTEVELSVEYNF